MVKINGVSFEKQYRRTTSRPIDSTDTWKSKEDAESYARNTEDRKSTRLNSSHP